MENNSIENIHEIKIGTSAGRSGGLIFDKHY